jgi:hypothetical protein
MRTSAITVWYSNVDRASRKIVACSNDLQPGLIHTRRSFLSQTNIEFYLLQTNWAKKPKNPV